MARLSDAFFVPCHSDIVFIKTVLKEKGVPLMTSKQSHGISTRMVSAALCRVQLSLKQIPRKSSNFLQMNLADQMTKKKFFCEKGVDQRLKS
jgi:hypothetical protein